MWERMSTGKRATMLSSKVINGREKLEHHPPPLLLLPSDAEMLLLGATVQARERERGKFRDQLVRGREDMK